MRGIPRIVNSGCVDVRAFFAMKGVSGFTDRLKSLLGDQSARSFARSVGISEGTLRGLLNGGKPSLETLVSIAETCSVQVNWLATGEGPMERDAYLHMHSMHSVDSELLRQVSRAVAAAHEAAGIKLPSDALIGETAAAYNDLLARAEDPNDRDELSSLIPWLEARLRKRLREARADPGTGKRLA